MYQAVPNASGRANANTPHVVDREGHATVGHAMVTVLQHHDVGDGELGKLVIKCVRMLVSISQTFYI